MALIDIQFFDLFVSHDPAAAWYKKTPGSLDRHPIPAQDHQEIKRLYAQLLMQTTHKFKIDWDTVRYRAERRKLVSDEIIFVCRRFLIRPNSLTELGIPRALADKLLDPDATDGMIIVLGGVGTGKSTVAGTLTKERVALHGGVAWTIENPVEADLYDPTSRGIIYQTEVDNEDEVGGEIVNTLRSSPNLIYIGEIHKHSAATESIHAALSGHLVISTQHGNNVQTGLSRLSTKAGDTSALADALRGAVWLDLRKKPDGKMQLITESLWVSGVENEEGIRATLRRGDFHLLKNDIDRQRRRLQEGNPL